MAWELSMPHFFLLCDLKCSRDYRVVGLHPNIVFSYFLKTNLPQVYTDKGVNNLWRWC